MMLPNLRYLSSMRARMTAGFIFILAPCLLIASAILPIFANRVTEIREKGQIGWLVERVSQRMAEPDWRAQLSELVAAKVPREDHIALWIVDREGTLVWRSPGPGPPWPWKPEADWSWEKLKASAPHEAKAADNAPTTGNPADREPPGPEKPRGEWRHLMVKAKALAEARALSAAKAAGKLPAWARKPADDWRAVGEFAIGPKSRPMTLVIFQSWWAIVHEQALQKLELLLLSLFAILAVAGGAWLLVGQTLSPIRRLANQAGTASVENLHVRLKAPSRDAEVVDLVETLNGLLSRLSETAAVKGRFYAAASHELRTPLQALSGHLEVALSRERTAEEYETFLQEAYKQAGRLTSLVKDLLLLHQLDSAPARPQEPVDLAEVCDGVLGHLGPLIEARGLKLSAELPPGAEVLAVPTHAEILIRNLVENAVKYAAPGGQVSLCLTSSEGRVRLEVFDECPPVPGWNPQKLFEPFYRPDAARSARTGGNGLGLAICRAIATANGWAVTLQHEPRGVRAVATFGAVPGG